MRGNCTNIDLMELIYACPYVIDKLREKNMQDLIDAYDSLLFDYKMSFGTLPPYKKGESWGFYYRIDDKECIVNSGINLKTKAEAQLAAVYDTRYELNNRIINDA